MSDRTDALSMALSGAASGTASDAWTGAAPDRAALTLHTQARVAGAYRWVEQRLFEVLGGWAVTEAVPEAQVVFDVYAQQHAWHAELFAERLPVLDGVDPVALTVAPAPEVARTLAVLAGADPGGDEDGGGGNTGGADAGEGTEPGALRTAPPADTLLRLVGLGRVVLPRLIAGYGLHLRRVSTVAGAPLGRSLRLVVRDELEQWQAVEVLTQSLLHGHDDVARATAHQQRLEQTLAGAGPGLVPWPAGPAPDGGGDWPA